MSQTPAGGGDGLASQQQSLGNVQVQGDDNTFNVIQTPNDCCSPRSYGLNAHHCRHRDRG